MPLLETISKYVIVPAAILYFAGWVYLYYFLFSIGVSFSSANMDVYTVCAYAISTFVYLLQGSRLVITLLSAAGLASAALIYVRIIHPHPNRAVRWFDDHLFRPLWKLATSHTGQAASFIVLLCFLYFLASAAGISHAKEIQAHPGPRIFFQFADSVSSHAVSACREIDGCYYGALASANSSGSLRKIMESSDYIVVLNADDLHVVLIPKTLVVFSDISNF